MKASSFRMAGIAAAVIGLSGTAAFAQQQQAGLYAYHTRAVGGCPAFDWHITAEGNGDLSGFVAWGDHTAKLAGKIQPNRQFEMNAKEVGGQGRNAVVKGTAAGTYITAEITGSGTPCDNQPLQIPRVAGGLAGGGG
jgi:hypothetical protein